MTREIGHAVRDGDAIAIRLEAGPRRGCYRVDAGEAPRLLEGRATAALCSGDTTVGSITPSRDLRILRGGFAAPGFLEGGPGVPAETAFLVPRAHLAAHYARFDGPVPVYGVEVRPHRAAAVPSGPAEGGAP
ncbi:MAG: hypothetical protein ABFC38_02195 [Methanospirillum sp.]